MVRIIDSIERSSLVGHSRLRELLYKLLRLFESKGRREPWTESNLDLLYMHNFTDRSVPPERTPLNLTNTKIGYATLASRKVYLNFCVISTQTSLEPATDMVALYFGHRLIVYKTYPHRQLISSRARTTRRWCLPHYDSSRAYGSSWR